MKLKLASISLCIFLGGCSIFAREFQITKTDVSIVDEGIAVSFYTMENLTELSKSRIVQFRCASYGESNFISGRIFIDKDEIFDFSQNFIVDESEKYIRADVAKKIRGYKYIALISNGREIQRLRDLDTAECFVIGVQKAPVTFPRSNIVNITQQEIQSLTSICNATRNTCD